MTEGEFRNALTEFDEQLGKLEANLKGADRFDFFQERTAVYIRQQINRYRNLLSRGFNASRQTPLEGWAAVEWRDAYVQLTAWLATSFSAEMDKVDRLARVQSYAEFARWLEGLHTTGRSNASGLHLPQRIA